MTDHEPTTDLVVPTPFGVWPPSPLPTSRTNFTPQAGTHPDDHNQANDAINTIVTKVASQDGTIAAVVAKQGASGMERGRTNIDAVSDGGSVRYTVIHNAVGGLIVDTGDGSGYTVPDAVYGVWFSTIPDGGDDMTCYLNVGAQSVAVGSRLVGDGATYGSWTGRVPAGVQINVRVRMPLPRAVVGGFLTIWKVAESS